MVRFHENRHIHLRFEKLEHRYMLSIATSQLPLPLMVGESFVVEDWNNKITKSDLGLNYFGGNAGELNDPKPSDESTEITKTAISPDIPDASGESLMIDIDFNRAPGGMGAFGGLFMSLFGLTDTLVSLDGSSVMRESFPGYFLNFDDIFAGFGSFADRSIEEISFDVKLASESPSFLLKVELKQEPDVHGAELDIFGLIDVNDTNWTTVRMSRNSFDNSQAGSGDPSSFDWTQVSALAFITEKQVFDPASEELVATNPDAFEFFLDNVSLMDTDGEFVDLAEITDPVSGGLDQRYEEAFLAYVRETSSRYFVDFASTAEGTSGIVQDRSTTADLMSVGGVGFQLTSYVVDAERGYIPHDEAAVRVHDILRVLHDLPQGPEAIGTSGHEGFFYHFLGIDGLRKQNFDRPTTLTIDESRNTVELSTIDTALAVAGAVTAGQYFNGADSVESEIRQLADAIYRRVNWPFMLNHDPGIASPHDERDMFYLGWKPNEARDGPAYARPDERAEGSYSGTPDDPAVVDFYTDEGVLIALLAMASPNPDHRLGRIVWDAMIRESNGASFVKTFPGALFTYEFASVWLDTEALGTDNHRAVNGRPAMPVNFFDNSRAAIEATRDYAIANPNNRSTWQNAGGELRWGISAAEGPYGEYFAYGAPDAALADDGGIVSQPASYVEEAEDGTGDGENMFRGNATAGVAVRLRASESRTLPIVVPFKTQYEVVVRYSNDSSLGPLENVEVSIDGEVLGSFIAEDTGDFGNGWNVFIDSDTLGPTPLTPGEHNITISVIGGDDEGVEIDNVTVRSGEVRRPLEDGTATVYGAASAIRHIPEGAVEALWQSQELELLHPRFGFADAFNLDIGDAVVTESPGGEILRTSGAWANYIGFGIDHGPMAIMIDNYLDHDFVPSLFMSHPTISAALIELFPDYIPADVRPALRTGVVTGATDTWQEVNLDHRYRSMVVLVSPNYDESNPPLVPRIRNAQNHSFELRLDRADGSAAPVDPTDVHFVVVEEGVYTHAEHGVTMEAVKFDSLVTDSQGSWIGEQRVYSNSYSDPVVFGQVMSSNDADWSVFWSRGATRTTPPSAANLYVGKHVGEDPDKSRESETIGYIVIEAGSGNVGNFRVEAGVGPDAVKGIGNAPPYTYSIASISDPISAIVSVAGMDGNNGGWPVLYRDNPAAAGRLNLAFDEDQMGDAERAHTTEHVAYMVFEPSTPVAPVAVDDNVQMDANTSVDISVLDNDTPSGLLEIVSFDQPNDGVVTGNGDGTLSFVPAAGFTGITAFDYTIGFAPQSLNATDTVDRDEFGSAVALDGQLAVIGARLGEDNPATNNSGLAYVFERTGGVWSEGAKLAANDASATDFFGSSVAIHAATIVVGAPLADDVFADSGAAYVYQQDQSGTGEWSQVAKLMNPMPATNDQFGTSVAISGETIAVGSWLDDDPDPNRAGTNHGSVSLYGRNVGGADKWGLITTIFNRALPSGAADKFGFSVSLAGDTLAASAHHLGRENRGAVFIHERNQGGPDNWGQIGRIDNPEPNAGDQFGWSVSLAGNTMAIGSPFDDTNAGRNAGTTFIFQRDTGNNDWGQVKKLEPDPNVDRNGNEANDRFGFSVSITGDSLLVGAPFTDSMFGSDGVAYQFSRNEGGADNWGTTAVTQPKDVGPGDRFGSSVSVSGFLAVFGAPKDNAPRVDTGSALFTSQQTDTATVTVDVVDPSPAPTGIAEPTDLQLLPIVSSRQDASAVDLLSSEQVPENGILDGLSPRVMTRIRVRRDIESRSGSASHESDWYVTPVLSPVRQLIVDNLLAQWR